MDIGTGNAYPSNALSNLSPHKFIFDGIECGSAEGALQSFKFSNPEMQKYVCTLSGLEAKFKGKKKKWFRTQTLFWNNEEIDRHSPRYQILLDELYFSLASNDRFRKALLASGDAVFKHSIGKNDPHRTILTVREFCSRLTKIRKMIRDGQL